MDNITRCDWCLKWTRNLLRVFGIGAYGMIKGWRALEEFTGMKEHRIRRAIGHYDFPRPVPVKEPQRTNGRIMRINSWSKFEVSKWMAQDSFPSMSVIT